MKAFVEVVRLNVSDVVTTSPPLVDTCPAKGSDVCTDD